MSAGVVSCFCTWGADSPQCCLNRPQFKQFPVKRDMPKTYKEPAVVIHPGVKVIVRDDLPPDTIFFVDMATIHTENLVEMEEPDGEA